MFRASTQPGLAFSQQVEGFIVGALYRRGPDIHDRFGGNRQRGISVPREGRYIFLFTGQSGRRHGYNDAWTDDGILHYFGEGQKGDMELSHGNLAIHRHLQDGRRLLVFRTVEKGIQRFEGEFVNRGFDTVQGIPDTDGNLRTAIVFRLEPVLDDVGATVMPLADSGLPEPFAHPTVRQALTEVRTRRPSSSTTGTASSVTAPGRKACRSSRFRSDRPAIRRLVTPPAPVRPAARRRGS